MTGRTAEASAPSPAAWEVRPPSTAVGAEGSSRLVDYVLLRMTGLVLSVLVLGHFAVTHFVTDVAANDSAFVARRLSSAVWIAWDATMLAAALAHGSIGVRVALADYTGDRRTGRLEGLVAAIAVVLFVVGAIAIARAARV
jgi:succinate dehydrogenase / fumarate reductase membrane anchor subunit